MRVLILDGNQNQAVASVRSLAQAGHHVLVGESASWSKAGWSRSCAGTFCYPDPHEDHEGFLQKIVAVAQTKQGTLVMPMTEATTLPISEHRDRLLAAGARLALPEHADLKRAFDKAETTRLAASLGIAVPDTVLIETAEEASNVARISTYPVVLKPQSSEEMNFQGKLRTAGRPRYASNSTQFLEAYREISTRASGVLVQQFVGGVGAGYFALMNHGELRAEFAHRRVRDVYPTGSGSALRISVEPDPEIRRASLALLQALNWHGVAMVEFRKAEGQPPVFMEVNGRFWNSLPLACYAGVDFPVLLTHMIEHGDIEPITSYRLGVRCRWLLGDTRHLVEVWKGPPAGFPGAYPSRVASLLRFFVPQRGTYHDLFQWRDPLPELGDWIHFAGRVASKFHARENTRA